MCVYDEAIVTRFFTGYFNKVIKLDYPLTVILIRAYLSTVFDRHLGQHHQRLESGQRDVVLFSGRMPPTGIGQTVINQLTEKVEVI